MKAREHVELGLERVRVPELHVVLAAPAERAAARRLEPREVDPARLEQARALAVEADRIAASAGAVSDPRELTAILGRLQALRSQASGLLASSNAALNSAKGKDDKARPTDTK